MRYFVWFALLGTILVATGATCIPLIDLNANKNPMDQPIQLAVSVLQPSADRAVALGTVVEISWTAANLTGEQAIATVLVRSQTDGSESIVAGGVIVDTTGATQSVAWNTADFGGGDFLAVVRIEAGGLREEDVGTAVITINTPPEFAFTEPFVDTTLGADIDPNDPNMAGTTPTIAIRWTASDPDGDGQAMLGLDEDGDHESGNEVFITDTTISVASDFDSIEWDGTDVDGAMVSGATYTLFAQVFDAVNSNRFVDAPARIIVPVEPNMPTFSLAVTQPEMDTQFLLADSPLTIEFTFDEADDVLIDLKVDSDDNHLNGNETTILAQRLIARKTNMDTFDWNGNDSDGGVVADGIYRPFMVVNRGAGAPAIVEASGLIFRRAVDNKPLIALLEPGADRDVNPGDFVTFQWRDDDPNESATIRLVLDDDPTPSEAVETMGAEREILSGREAKGDGVQDSFAFQIPADLVPGRYFVFALIGRSGMGDEHTSIAPAEVVVLDPNQP